MQVRAKVQDADISTLRAIAARFPDKTGVARRFVFVRRRNSPDPPSSAVTLAVTPLNGHQVPGVRRAQKVIPATDPIYCSRVRARRG
jgi:hypothetical protein